MHFNGPLDQWLHQPVDHFASLGQPLASTVALTAGQFFSAYLDVAIAVAGGAADHKVGVL
jgi:hypothetical protein